MQGPITGQNPARGIIREMSHMLEMEFLTFWNIMGRLGVMLPGLLVAITA